MSQSNAERLHPCNGFIDLGASKPVEVLFKIDERLYILREATAGAAVKYRNSASRVATVNEDGVRSMGDIHSCEPILVSECLYPVKQVGDGLYEVDGPHVPEEFILSKPVRMQQLLFDKVEEISEGLKDPMDANSIRKHISRLQKLLVRTEQEESSKNLPGR